jgi:selenocysteine lyase/cysteine desulfurase
MWPIDDPGGVSGAVARAQQEFGSDTVWLNSASMGLPPRRTVTALRTAIEDWEAGRADAVGYDAPLNSARRLYAGIVGVGSGQVAVGSQASVLVGLVAASLPPGSEVLTVAGEFTSVTFPFHARVAAGHDITIREVPLQSLAEEGGCCKNG